MVAESISLLTERERECLRAISAGAMIKNVGADVGIAQETARQHLASARAKLGVNSSEEAARLLALNEAEDTPPSEVTPTKGIEYQPSPGLLSPSNEQDRQPRFEGVQEEQIAFRAIGSSLRPKEKLLFLRWLGDGNDLSIGARLGSVAALIVGIALAIGTLASSMAAVSQLLLRLRH